MGLFDLFKKKRKNKHTIPADDNCPKEEQLYDAVSVLAKTHLYMLKLFEKMNTDKEFGKIYKKYPKSIKIFRDMCESTLSMGYHSSLTFIELIITFTDVLKFYIQESLASTGANMLGMKYIERDPPMTSGPAYLKAEATMQELKDELHTGPGNVIIKNEKHGPANIDNVKSNNDNIELNNDTLEWFYKGPIVMQFTSDGSVFMNREMVQILYEEQVYKFGMLNRAVVEPDRKDKLPIYIGRTNDGYLIVRSYIPGLPHKSIDFKLNKDRASKKIEYAEIDNYDDAILLREFLGIGLREAVKLCFKIEFDVNAKTIVLSGCYYDEDSPTPWNNDKLLKLFLPKEHMALFK